MDIQYNESLYQLICLIHLTWLTDNNLFTSREGGRKQDIFMSTMVVILDGCSFHYAHQRKVCMKIMTKNRIFSGRDLSIEVANHSQSIFTLIKNSNFSILNVFYHKCKKKPNELLF